MREESWYDQALVCVRGHVITSMLSTSPQHAANFCGECGAETISACPRCNENIRGWYHVPGVISVREWKPPAHCHACGAPLPWTEARQKALAELLEVAGIPEAERATLAASVPALAAQGPETTVAVARWQRFLASTGKQLASVFREVLVDVASEAAKKMLFP